MPGSVTFLGRLAYRKNNVEFGSTGVSRDENITAKRNIRSEFCMRRLIPMKGIFV